MEDGGWRHLTSAFIRFRRDEPALFPGSGGEGEIQMQPRTADEAGHFAVLGRMADEAGGFVDDQQIVVLKNDVEQFFHFCNLFSRQAGVSLRR